MKKKGFFRLFALMLVCVLGFSCLPMLSGCTKDKKDSIVIMTEELSGLFNPFYATAGADMSVVGMTQIGMLSTDKNGQPVAGDEHPTVVKAFSIKEPAANIPEDQKETVYTFVLKNGLKFSDGHALTMNDVMFNIYEYLDRVYTGSSTMYSIKIKGLQQYRTQTNLSDNSGLDDTISRNADAMADERLLELIMMFETEGLIEGSTSSYSLSPERMKSLLYDNVYPVSDGFKNAVASEQEQAKLTDADFSKMLYEDYLLTLKTFKEELGSDYKAAKESYDTTTKPYSEWKQYFNDKKTGDLFKFFLYEGYITPEYKEVEGRKDKTTIVKFNNTSIVDKYKNQEEAIERVYNDKISSELNIILQAWGTAGKLKTQYAAKAMEILLHREVVDGQLKYPNISGVVSLGHTTTVEEVNVNGVTYKVAHEYNADGSVANENEYAVLQITVEGIDPKAIYNFGFTVAPAHYYTADAAHPNGREIDIKNNKFGVEWADSSFQSNVIQSQQHQEVPLGAGAFRATDSKGSNMPKGSEFVKNNIVYYEANENFMFPVKAQKLRMQVVSSTDALDKLQNGEVDYVEPQFTKANSDRLDVMKKSGFKSVSADQLGYGYIGVNAGKVPNVNVRRAIMASMQISLALEYYKTGTCQNISWPMSIVSWAHPKADDGVTSKPNGKDYMQWTGVEDAKTTIKKYMDLANVQAGHEDLKITFTIAGASITEHPTYPVFKQAAGILNSLGWDVEVKADSQALTKLATGSLAVWAAAWGSTIDPDMYQVYHKNSTATSVYSWGYREIKANTNKYAYEYSVINELSNLIDDGRSIMDQKERAAIYEKAMDKVLDLAVELPVYQRQTLYAYNANTIKGLNDDVNPYSSPLEKIWELELVG